MFEEIYAALITKANEILSVASLLRKQYDEIEQYKKQKSLQYNGGLIYQMERVSGTHWKIYVKHDRGGNDES